MEMDFRFESVNGLAKALGGRIDLLEKIFGKKARDNLKYSDIQKIVKSGFASEFFDLGDEIMTKYTATDGTVYDFPWHIVDFRDVYWENDPTPHPGMVLQGKYATAETLVYDANDADWSHSSIRQWLNSNAEKGNWWTSTHDGDTTPTELNTYNGFMYGFDEKFLNSLMATKLTTYVTTTFGGDRTKTIDTYDKFFIPSVVELYGYRSLDWKALEEKAFQYFINEIGSDKPLSTEHPSRIFKSITDVTTPINGNLRSYYYDDPDACFWVLKDGRVNTMASIKSTAKFILPCCVIS